MGVCARRRGTTDSCPLWEEVAARVAVAHRVGVGEATAVTGEAEVIVRTIERPEAEAKVATAAEEVAEVAVALTEKEKSPTIME